MVMTEAARVAAIEHQGTFVCAWCYEADPDEPSEHTHSSEWLGGFAADGQPLCDFCVDAAMEDRRSQ